MSIGVRMRWLVWGAMATLLCGVPAPRSIAQGATEPAEPQTSAAPAEVVTQAIAGRVTSAVDGHAIANATLTLSQQQRAGQRQARVPFQPPGTSVQTDANGRYRFSREAPGRYALRASAPGYLGSLFLEHDGFSSAVVTGAGLETDHLNFALVPEASLHGRVLDETEEPVQARVILFREASDELEPINPDTRPSNRFRQAGSTQADEDGRYEFLNLRPGQYYVAASGTPWYAVHPRPQQSDEQMLYRSAIDPALDVAYPVTFYPHSTSEAGATAIPLKAGQRAAANLLMQPEQAVTLSVQMPAAGTTPDGAMQPLPALSHKVFGTDQGLGSVASDRVGDTVVITGIPPGQYSLRSFGRRGLANADEKPLNLVNGSVAVSMPSPLPAAGGKVSITLRTPAGAALPESVRIRLQRLGTQRGAEQEPQGLEQGVARFTDVPAGEYRIRLEDEGQTWNVNRLVVHGEVVPSKLLRVNGDVSAELVSSSYAPEVDGVVHSTDGTAHPGSLVVLVPAGTDSGRDLYRADQSDLDGGFQFSNVLPGNYLLVAIDNDWRVNWRDLSALQSYLSHAVPVTVPSAGPRVFLLPEVAVAQQR